MKKTNRLMNLTPPDTSGMPPAVADYALLRWVIEEIAFAQFIHLQNGELDDEAATALAVSSVLKTVEKAVPRAMLVLILAINTPLYDRLLESAYDRLNQAIEMVNEM